MRELPRVLELSSLAKDVDLEELSDYLETLKQEHLLSEESGQELIKNIFVKEEIYYD